MVSKRTPQIDFQRQLLPQPPKHSEPFFCYINTLVFYALDGKGNHILNPDGKSYKEHRRYLIPEADWLGFERGGTEETNDLDHRHKQWNVHVEYDKRWGWLLKFSITHEQAKKIWSVLFPQVNFNRDIEDARHGNDASDASQP